MKESKFNEYDDVVNLFHNLKCISPVLLILREVNYRKVFMSFF